MLPMLQLTINFMNETLHCKDIVQCAAEDKSSKEIILTLRSWS